jgi:hypothetical protein
MGNCRSNLSLGTFQVDLNDREATIGKLYDLLECDNDLTENEDYFREDTLELGFDCEAERIWKERTKGKQVNTKEQFEKVFLSVWSAITDQEYYGDYDYDITELGDNKLFVSYCYGGNNSW